MGVEERYIRAVRSSHMRLRETAIGDADVIVAAGMASAGRPVETGVRGEVREESIEGLGMILCRLRSEFDSARREYLAIEAAHLEAIRQADVARRFTPPKHLTPAEIMARRNALDDYCEEVRAAARLSAEQAARQIRVKLPTLDSAEQAVGRFAWSLTQRRNLNLTPMQVSQLVDDVLDAWLDNVCHRCNGLGFTGTFSGPKARCRTCRETGNRRRGLFSSMFDGQWLAEKMLFELDRCSTAAMTRTAARLR